MTNQELAEELHNSIIRKFKNRKVYSSFNENIWGADLAHIELTSKFNKRIHFLVCVIDVFSTYTRVIALKDKKGITITDAF